MGSYNFPAKCVGFEPFYKVGPVTFKLIYTLTNSDYRTLKSAPARRE
ncbi:MAG TPA: hypothetical protein VLA74_02085 [Nitrososphaeraceae archaeon]|nr:hypothetical protein [Nitrososphaeraceae archaeon]